MSQITSSIMMIRPANFGFNTQTAENNAFQTNDQSKSPKKIQALAQVEFDDMVSELRINGVEVIVIEDTDEPTKPDAIFPNNWISFHKNGSVITYPMYAPNRRVERREDIVDLLEASFEVKKRYSLEHYEEESLFLEGTGSMLMDRENNIAYACISERTDPTILDKFCVLLGASRVVFNSVDKDGSPIYHTNVMMALGQQFVVICLDSIPDENERQRLLTSFKQTNKKVVEITQDQVEKFAGNMLQVKNLNDEPILVMSQSAYESLELDQIEVLSSFTKILPIAIPTIEHYGGGSVRCMMAEIFLPKKN